MQQDPQADERGIHNADASSADQVVSAENPELEEMNDWAIVFANR
ncbi:hypothetical protein N9D23_11975 [Rubripirellula sp.]|nr:hypothetical protein [Rubripirellula sp.]